MTMTECIKREDAIDAVLDVYYNTPDIDLSGERLESAILKVQPTYIAPSGRLRGVTYEDGKVTNVHIMDTDDVVKVFEPVRHGHLVVNWLGDCHCSNCGEYCDSAKPFCASCGARFDEPEMREN